PARRVAAGRVAGLSSHAARARSAARSMERLLGERSSPPLPSPRTHLHAQMFSRSAAPSCVVPPRRDCPRRRRLSLRGLPLGYLARSGVVRCALVALCSVAGVTTAQEGEQMRQDIASPRADTKQE